MLHVLLKYYGEGDAELSSKTLRLARPNTAFWDGKKRTDHDADRLLSPPGSGASAADQSCRVRRTWSRLALAAGTLARNWLMVWQG
jgi:hypothetical protein